MYEIVGENAIIRLEKGIKVSKVPVDLKLHEKLFFGDHVRINKPLARRIPGFYGNDVYLPRMFAPNAEELELMRDGGRSSINPTKHVTLDLFGVEQTYVEKRKGVGASGYRTEPRFEWDYGELGRYLEENDLLFLDIDKHGYDRPYGSQRKGFALNELEKSKLLEKLGVKHTPILSVFPIPKHAEKKARELADTYFGDKTRPKKTRYYQEVILFPGNIRAPSSYDFDPSYNEDFTENLKRLGVNLNDFSKVLEKDLLHFLEIVPKTLTKTGDEITKTGGEYTTLGFSSWNFSDCVLAPTGLYVSDLESVSFYKIKKADLIPGLISDDRSIFYDLNNFLNMMENAAYRYLPEKSNDEIVGGLIDILNTSKYFDVEIVWKEQDGEVDRYLLKFKMDCKNGIGVEFNKYVSIDQRTWNPFKNEI